MAREPGVVAGLAVAELAFVYAMGEAVEVTDRVPDGTRAWRRATRCCGSPGLLQDLLTAERTALNFACHLSGVATATSHWVAALEGTRAKVLDTRKTLPGWRALQKYAVRCGGGVNHRFSLSDRAMVKDNHVVAAGGVVPAYQAVVAANPGLRVEVEVTDLDQLRELLDAGLHRDPARQHGPPRRWPRRWRITAGRATLEASGGLTLDRAREVAETGVDFISVGALTHSVNVFDLGLDLDEDDMTLLCADIGNSHTVLGLVDDGAVEAEWRVATDERRTSDEWAVVIRGLLGDALADGRRHRRLRDRPVGAARVARHARPALRRRHGRGGRAGRADRRPGAHGQPARGRLGPDPQRAGRGHRLRRPGHRRRLRRHRDHVRRGQRARDSTSAARSARASSSPSPRSAAAAPSCARSSWCGRGP